MNTNTVFWTIKRRFDHRGIPGAQDVADHLPYTLYYQGRVKAHLLGIDFARAVCALLNAAHVIENAP